MRVDASVVERPLGPARHAAPAGRLRAVAWPAVTVTTLALLWFGWRVGTPGPWRDEAATMAACRRGLGDLLAMTRQIDLVHLAHYLTARLALAVDDSVTAVRWVSVLMAALAAGTVTALGRRLAGTPTGLLAGASFVAMPLASRWAQDARSVAMVTALAALATALLLAAVRTRNRRGPWIGYGLVVALLGLVNVLGLLLVAAHVVFLLLTHPGRTVRRALLVDAGVTVALVPWLVAAFAQRGQIAWIERPHLYDLTALYIHAFGSKLVPPVVVVGALATLLVHRGLPPGGVGHAFALGAAWATVPPVLLWTASQVFPMWDAHYMVYTLPGLALLVAAEVAALSAALSAALTRRSRLPRPRRTDGAVGARAAARTRARSARRPSPGGALVGTAVVLLLAVIGVPDQLAHRGSDGHDEDVRAVADYLRRNARPGDGVLFVPFDLRDLSATYPDAFAGLDDVALASSPIASDTLHGVEATAAELPARIAGRARIWLITGDFVAPSPVAEGQDDAKRAALGAGYRQVGRADVPAFRILRYEPVP